MFALRFTQQFVRVDVPFILSSPLAARKPNYKRLCMDPSPPPLSNKRHARFKILLSYNNGILVDMKPFLCNRSPEEMVCS